MVALLDTTVFVDLLGSKKPERHAAEHVISSALAGSFVPLVALQSVQELAEIKRRQGHQLETVCDYGRWIGKSFRLLSHLNEDLDEVLNLISQHPGLGGGDAMIWASAKRNGVEVLVTRDKTFGQAFGEGWINPMDPEGLSRLASAQ